MHIITVQQDSSREKLDGQFAIVENLNNNEAYCHSAV